LAKNYCPLAERSGDRQRADGGADEQEGGNERCGKRSGGFTAGSESGEHLKYSLFVSGPLIGPMPTTLQEACQMKKVVPFQ
jgi:hypothetical protein